MPVRSSMCNSSYRRADAHDAGIHFDGQPIVVTYPLSWNSERASVCITRWRLQQYECGGGVPWWRFHADERSARGGCTGQRAGAGEVMRYANSTRHALRSAGGTRSNAPRYLDPSVCSTLKASIARGSAEWSERRTSSRRLGRFTTNVVVKSRTQRTSDETDRLSPPPPPRENEHVIKRSSDVPSRVMTFFLYRDAFVQPRKARTMRALFTLRSP